MKAGVAVEALALTLGAFRLGPVDFTVRGGEILAVLGPNGSGKSVTLETIAGFHRPDEGRVTIGGRDVTALPPERRNVGFVVQNFGLFPHLSVEQNVAIAWRGDGADRGGAGGDTALALQGGPAGLLAYFGVAHLARRAPADLSPGEKQRVALARALARAPDVFLFDEPFAALDTQTRERLRDELIAFLRALGIAAIFVTHDHADARALADTVVVLREGAMVQRGPAAEIFHKPVNSFVARFVGIENVLDAQIAELSNATAMLTVGKATLRAVAPPPSFAVGCAVHLSIAAEDVTVMAGEGGAASPAATRLQGRVTALRALGALVTAELDCGFTLKAYLLAPQARAMKLGVGDPVAIEIDAAAIHVMAD